MSCCCKCVEDTQPIEPVEEPVEPTEPDPTEPEPVDGPAMLGAMLGKPGTRMRAIGCTIRRVSPTEWTILHDTGHNPLGVSSVEIVGGNRVRLHFDFTATKVVTFWSTLDDSFAKSTVKLRQGASVSFAYADIYFFTDASGSTPVDPGLLSAAGANVWIGGLFEVA